MAAGNMPEDQSKQRIESLLFYGAVILVFYLAYSVFEPFLIPLGWAAVVVICTAPLHERFIRSRGPAQAAAIMTLLVTVVLVGPALTLMGGLVSQATAVRQFFGEGGN